VNWQAVSNTSRMNPIVSDRVIRFGDKWYAICACGNGCQFAFKQPALKMVEKGTCRYCRKDYRSVGNNSVEIYKNHDGKWCKKCSGCGIEQTYTRKDHAKQSFLSDWQCKKCVASAKGFSHNGAIGAQRRMFNKFQKSAAKRGLDWKLSFEYFCSIFTGKCELTGWEILTTWNNCTASLDRIDSSLGYIEGNVRWVHVMVNMCKNKYSDKDFISMCNAIASKHKL